MTSPAVTRLARVKELEHLTSPGPWIAVSDCDCHAVLSGDCFVVESENHHPPIGHGQSRGGLRWKPDAEFIAESRELVPKMRKALEAALELARDRKPSVSTDPEYFDYGWNAAMEEVEIILERELGGDQ